jgi:hypothetical protein
LITGYLGIDIPGNFTQLRLVAPSTKWLGERNREGISSASHLAASSLDSSEGVVYYIDANQLLAKATWFIFVVSRIKDSRIKDIDRQNWYNWYYKNNKNTAAPWHSDRSPSNLPRDIRSSYKWKKRFPMNHKQKKEEA